MTIAINPAVLDVEASVAYLREELRVAAMWHQKACEEVDSSRQRMKEISGLLDALQRKSDR